MKIGRVCGTVVSSIQHRIFEGRRLLMVQLEDPAGKAVGEPIIAINAIDAGAGERVLLIDEGNSARQILSAPDAPIRTLIVGIIDEISEGE
jgi:ethanolamine utilization protein EutN